MMFDRTETKVQKAEDYEGSDLMTVEIFRALLCTERESGTGSGAAPYTAADPSALPG